MKRHLLRYTLGEWSRSRSFVSRLCPAIGQAKESQPRRKRFRGKRPAWIRRSKAGSKRPSRARSSAVNLSGCVVLIGRREGIVFEHAYGNRAVEPKVEPMTTDTLFDMASLTKPLATATSIMILVERGQLRLSDKVAKFFPDFAANGKEDVTIEHLLTHSSGLIPDNPIGDYNDGWKSAEKKICDLKLLTAAGLEVQVLGCEFHSARQDCRKRRGQAGR